MPNGHGPKEYGKHKYAHGDGTTDCEHGCGCWMSPSRSGGPTGLDPFGTCPKNPKDGKLLGGAQDYDHVVTKRISDLSSSLYKAEVRLEQTKPSKAKLAEELASARNQLAENAQLFYELKRLLKLAK